MKRLLFILVFLALPFFLVQKASAACNPIYNGGPTCTNNTFSVQKEVLNPETNVFVHDLGMTDPKYHSNDLVPFQITVTNSGKTALTQVVVKDIFPKEIQFSDGPGVYDKATRTLTFMINNLAPHHAQLFTINSYAETQDKFPGSTFCVTNQVSALPSSGLPSEDSSQVCMTKITATPSTGPISWQLPLLTLLAACGLIFYKKAHKLSSR